MARELIASGDIIADERSLSRQLNMLVLEMDEKRHVLTGFVVDRGKRDDRLRTSGFFA